MTIWNHPPEFSEAFLAEHHDYVLVDTFHRIKAHLLYPLACGCKTPCRCGDLRARVILSLNVGSYNQVEDRQKDPYVLSALRHFLKIPEDRLLRRNLDHIYPPWLIQEKFQEKEAANHFRIVDQYVWALLRSGATHTACGYQHPYTSFNEALEMVSGNGPLKSKGRNPKQEAPLCGEKGYLAQLKTYKAVCHFIAAFKLVDPLEEYPCFTLTDPGQIEKFLKFSLEVREMLLELQARNSKEKTLFTESSLILLPDWVNSDDIHIPVEPYVDKVQAFDAQYNAAYAASKL